MGLCCMLMHRVYRLYHRARLGQIQHFTGIDSPYEPPETPDYVIDGANGEPENAA